MWCPACRADVAAELSLDSRHFRCARCSTELGTAAGSLGQALPAATAPTDAERNARELLARWNAQNLLESPPSRSAAVTPNNLSRPVAESMSETMGSSMAADAKPTSDLTSRNDDQPRRRRKKRRFDPSDERRLAAEESLRTSPQRMKNRSGNWGIAIGQICAYFGIGLITCGTAVVLWGYFGGPTHFAPTGWLVTTVGQMFLFLGVVTLVSSGMEQTSADVAARIDVLGQKLIRIERRHRREEMAGPHHPLPQRNRRRSSSSDQEEFSPEPA